MPRKERTGPVTRGSARRVFASIAREVEPDGSGLALPDERFEFWARQLWLRYPRETHPMVYDELGGLALKLGSWRYRVAHQLFALATLGLDDETAREYTHSSFFRASECSDTRLRAQEIARSAVLPKFPLKRVELDRTAATVVSRRPRGSRG